MEYMCAHCGRQFAFGDFISFCPYCGWNLKGKAADHEAEISQTIDSIWGYGAACKSEFSDVIESCMNLIQIYARDSMEKVWPAKDLCHYEKNYAAMQKCQNRKTLLARVQGFVYALDAVIQKLSDRLPEQAMHTTGNVMAETESMVRELYDFLGVRYDPSRRLCPVEEMCRAEVVYTREQLQVLYHLVLKAYEKQLQKQQIESIKEVFLAVCDAKGKLTVYPIRPPGPESAPFFHPWHSMALR